MKIKIVKAKGNSELCTVDIDSGLLVDELKKQIASKSKPHFHEFAPNDAAKVAVLRQRLQIGE